MGFKNYLWDEAWELNVSRGKVRSNLLYFVDTKRI